MKFREHRGGLAESMETVVELNSVEEFVDHILGTLADWPGVNLTEITVEKYGGFDDRIGWDTHIVVAKGYGVLGFTDGPLQTPQTKEQKGRMPDVQAQ